MEVANHAAPARDKAPRLCSPPSIYKCPDDPGHSHLAMHLATLTLTLLLLTVALATAQEDQQDTYNAMIRENEIEDAGSRDLTSADKDLLAMEPRRLKKMLEAEAHPRERRGLKKLRKGLRRIGHKIRKVAGSY